MKKLRLFLLSLWFRSFVGSILQIIGLATISIGFGTIFIPAGIIVAGVGFILFGLAIERRD
jgi:hypothetical protein